MDLERLPSGKFDINELVLELAVIAYNILRIIGQESIGRRGDKNQTQGNLIQHYQGTYFTFCQSDCRLAYKNNEFHGFRIRYIAEMNHRKINDEFKLMVENHIKQYEQNFGTIQIENQEKTINPKNNIETLINSGNVIVGDNSTINI